MRKSLVMMMAVITLAVIVPEPVMAASNKPVNTKLYNYMNVCHQSDHRTYGVSSNGDSMFTEGEYGLDITIQDDDIIVKYYDHKQKEQPAHVELYFAETRLEPDDFYSCYAIRKDLGEFKWNEKKVIKCSELEDGTYELRLTAHGKTNECGFLYKNGDDCVTFLYKDTTQWDDLTAKLNPEDYLSTENLTYPSSGEYEDDVVEVKGWEEIAEKLVYNDKLSDEYKVYLFVNYLANNYAYDHYVVDHGFSRRSDMEERWDDPSLCMLNTHVGVCWDFTNVLIIMCRHYGIPATSVTIRYTKVDLKKHDPLYYYLREDFKSNHAYALVWMNNEWWPIDLTRMNKYDCYEENTTQDKWVINRSHTHIDEGMNYFELSDEEIKWLYFGTSVCTRKTQSWGYKLPSSHIEKE